MTKFMNGLLAFALLAFTMFQATALAADAGLLSLVMPDAKVIAGIQVESGRNSPFGQYVLSHMQLDDENFNKFMADTGFDPRRDLSEIVMASNWAADTNGRWLVLTRGFFNTARIANSVHANGGSVTDFQGVSIFSGDPKADHVNMANSVIAILDQSNAAMGDVDSVKATIQRFQSKSKPAALAVSRKIGEVSANNDFWFVTLVPISEFSGAMPDPNLSQAMKGNLLQAITQASGGIKFGSMVRISAEAVTRSEKDAGALVDVVRFIGGLIQLNKDKSPTASEVSSLLDTMDLNTSGNVMTMSLSIPEAQLEKILDSAKSEAKHTARKQ
jgi:hypothetical protein